LFDKHLGKISAATVSKFGSLENVIRFLECLRLKGNLALAVQEVDFILPMRLPIIIKGDKHLGKCVDLALKHAAEIAEAVLYDRVINGYEELTYNKDGECIARKKKYCSKSLLEYLKANSDKYQIGGERNKGSFSGKVSKNRNGDTNPNSHTIPNTNSNAISFEVESYGSDKA
jgi:hypothetical protein